MSGLRWRMPRSACSPCSGCKAAQPEFSFRPARAICAYDCAAGAEALVIVTEWDMFRALDFRRLGEIMVAKTLVDLRNVYSAEDVRRTKPAGIVCA